MDTKRDNWIEETLNAAACIRELPISGRLKQRLGAIPNEFTVMSVVIPLRSVYLAAAGFALLITMNLLAVKNQTKEESKESNIYTEYFSYLDQL